MQSYFIDTQPSAGRYYLHRPACSRLSDEQVERAEELPALGEFPDLASAMQAGKRLLGAYPCPYCCFRTRGSIRGSGAESLAYSMP